MIKRTCKNEDQSSNLVILKWGWVLGKTSGSELPSPSTPLSNWEAKMVGGYPWGDGFGGR